MGAVEASAYLRTDFAFRRLVLGCIDADRTNERLTFSFHFSVRQASIVCFFFQIVLQFCFASRSSLQACRIIKKKSRPVSGEDGEDREARSASECADLGETIPNIGSRFLNLFCQITDIGLS